MTKCIRPVILKRKRSSLECTIFTPTNKKLCVRGYSKMSQFKCRMKYKGDSFFHFLR